MTTDYENYLQRKTIKYEQSGFAVKDVNDKLFDFQRDITKWALKRGKACLFEQCGLGKTPMQLSWAEQVLFK
jgi:hypothetical protein